MNTADPATHVELRDFLTDLAARGVRLSEADGVLRCEAPRGVLGAESRAALASRKQEILAFLAETRRQADEDSPLAQLEPTPPGAPAPLSFAQRRLWLQEQLEEGSTAYNMRIALRVRGELDVPALRHAVAGLVARHAVLRTGFELRGEHAVQIVAEEVEVPFETIEPDASAPGDAALEAIMARATKTPFDLARPPLLRVVLIPQGEREHVLLVTLHHLVGDGASLSILASEIGELYAARVERRPPRLPQLALQYADFSRWQRRTLTEERLGPLRERWVERLRGAPPRLELPTDRPRRSSPDHRGEELTFTLSPTLGADLRALARTSGTTLFTTLLTGFAVLMARYSHQEDLVIGCPISQRSHPELEPLIGMFVNSLALRIRLEGNPTFQELLERVRATTSDAYAHQELPLDQLVEALRPERATTHHPVFQVMFIHDNAPVAIPELGGLRFELLDHRRFDAKFDLMLSVTELPEGIRGRWEFRRDRFDAATIRRATEHLEVVLEAMALEPRQRVMQAPLADGAERQRVLEEWGRGPSLPEDGRRVLARFREQARRRGGATAVECGDASATYAELDRRVDALARRLLALGVAPGHAVAVMLPRSIDLLASLLAAHAVGCAYVPLDPAHPIGRLNHMLEDAGVAALVTDRELPAGLTMSRDAVVRCDQEGSADEEATAPPTSQTDDGSPDDAAYLMYTSGSTGAPKAVVVTHRGLNNYLAWATRAYDVSPATRAAVSTSVAFDATITTLFTPLVGGGTVVLLPEPDPIATLARLMQTDDVDLVKLTPAHIDALRATAEEVRPGGVQTIVVGGEQLLAEHVAWCQRVAPSARVINEYGPTEAVVGCCVHEVPAGAEPPPVVPIGRPIANTQLYVLNPWLEPMPVGVPGELYIGGAGVARGYHGQPELTDARFGEDPYGAEAGARLYRTGDRVVWQPDGELRFIGRVDNQVKIRGFRVELGEIEAALGRHPAVRQAVVIDRAGAGARPQLAAYVVLDATAPGVDELREHLGRWLPEHMIPGALVVMPELPLTPNAKIDRAALPSPEVAAAESGPARPPATALERQLVELWSGVLGRDTVRLDDNFFHLGGDSILGIQLVARAREHGLRFAPKDLVEHQTIAQLARVVTREVATPTASAEVIEGPQSLTPIQAWFFAQRSLAEHHFNQSIMLELPVDCDPRALGRALQAVVDHHDVLRARFERRGDEVHATIAPREHVGLVQIDLPDLGDDERRATLERLVARAQGALDLRRGPVFQPTLLWMGPGRAPRLLLCAHHLVVDGVSWRILVEDLRRAYSAASVAETIELPAKTSAYGEWARQLERWSGSEALAAQRQTWTRRADADDADVALAFDHAPTDDATQERHMAEVSRTLSPAQTEAIRSAAAAAYHADVQDVLLTAVLASVTEPGTAGSLCVELESHGREDLFPGVDVSRTVGWFTSVYPVRFALEPHADPGSRLMHVKETLRAVPNRGVGYGVMRYLSADAELRARLAAAPAQLCVNYFGRLDAAEPACDGFRLARESCEPQRSPLGRRRHPLEINAAIHRDALEISVAYSRRRFEPTTIDAMANRVVDALQALVTACESASAPRYTPSDFPDVDLDQGDLDQLLADLDLED